MLWIDIGTYPANFRRYFQFSGLISSYQFNIRGTDNHGINDPSGTVVSNANPLAYAAVVQRLNDGPNLDAALIGREGERSATFHNCFRPQDVFTKYRSRGQGHFRFVGRECVFIKGGAGQAGDISALPLPMCGVEGCCRHDGSISNPDPLLPTQAHR